MNDNADRFRKTAYFPTLIFQIDVEQADTLNKSLLKSIYLERQKNKEGIVRSNVNLVPFVGVAVFVRDVGVAVFLSFSEGNFLKERCLL